MLKEIGIGAVGIAWLAVGATSFSFYSQHIKSNQVLASSINATQAKTKQLKTQTANLSKASVEKQLAKGGVNLDTAKSNASQKINDIFKIAYSNMNDDTYKSQKGNFNKTLGTQLGNRLAEVTSPKNGVIYSDSIDAIRIGYGQYNANTHMIKVFIAVTFKATSTSSNNSLDYWTADYNVKTGHFGDEVQYTKMASTSAITSNTNGGE